MSSDFIRDLISLATLREKMKEKDGLEKLTKTPNWSF